MKSLIHEPKNVFFIGYSPTQKGYKCFYPVSRKVFVTMEVTFFETRKYYEKDHLREKSESEDAFK